MAAAPWAENQHKVVIEFLKTGSGAKRLISLKHNGAVVPPQLAGRVNPAVWGAFMADIEQVAQAHPYVVKPSAGRVGSWALAGLMGAVLGCCMVNPDGGDYETWLPQVQAIIDRHAPAFASVGCQLSLQRAQYSHWVQVDILSPPGVVAAGHPVSAPPPHMGAQPYPPKPGFEPTPGPAAYPPPGAYPPPAAAGKPGYEGKPWSQ